MGDDIDPVWVTILFTIFNMVNAVIHSQKLLAIIPLGYI